MLQHVLRPSQKIDEPFAAYAIATADGRLLSGLLVEKNDQAVVVKTAEKKLIRIARDDIEELRRARSP